MKLFKALRLLSTKEYSSFAAFLKTPHFNKRKDVIKLFDKLQNTGFTLDAEETFTEIYPNENYTTTKWHLLKSRLLKLLEDYFAHQEFHAQATNRQLYLAQFYRKKKKPKDFENCLRQAGRTLDKAKLRHADYWQLQYEMAFMRYDYIESQNRVGPTNLQRVIDRLDIYFIASKLKQACQLISRKAIGEAPYEMDWMPEVLERVSSNRELLEIPAIAIYYYCYRAVTYEGLEADFQLLRQTAQEHQDCFPAAEIRDIYLIATNFCIRKVNAGEQNFVREAFELYLLSLNNGILLQDGIMPESTFNNLVALAIKLDEFSWAEEFISQYRYQLKRNFQEPLYHFCLAKLHYAQEERTKCLQHLVQVKTKAPFLYLGANTLQIKCYYEEGEWDALDALLDSLRVYLHRRKELGARKINYENLLSFMRRLLQLKSMDVAERKKFKLEVESASVFTERVWMLSKLNTKSS